MIDGTHVFTKPPKKDKIKYYDRKGAHTMNIIVAADFNLCFIYALSGWEGSMHDYNVFKHVVYGIGRNASRFPHPKEGNGNNYFSLPLQELYFTVYN